MTNLINQITINGKTTTFLNYVNQLVGGVNSSGTSGGVPEMFTLLETHFGAKGGLWNGRPEYNNIKIRFPVPWETMTGAVNDSFNSITNARVILQLGFIGGSGNLTTLNSTTTSTTWTVTPSISDVSSSFRPIVFGVVNDYAIAIACFQNTARSTAYYCYGGWAKDPQFSTSGPERVRNLVYMDSNANPKIRVAQENTNSFTALTTTQPTLTCQTSTPGANSSDMIIRDSAAPNTHIGNFWHIIRLPSSAVVGRIYKNTGVDPDTGVIETDQKAFWMCVGSYGSEKIGMRVWTEGIT